MTDKYKCPNCGSTGPFKAALEAVAMIGDGGDPDNWYTSPSDAVVERGCWCMCAKCDFVGSVSDILDED